MFLHKGISDKTIRQSRLCVPEAIVAVIQQATNPMVVLDAKNRIFASNDAWQTCLLEFDHPVFDVGSLWTQACEQARCEHYEMSAHPVQVDNHTSYLRLPGGRCLEITQTQINRFTLLNFQESDLVQPTNIKDIQSIHPIFRLVENFDSPAFVREKDRLITVNDGFVQLLGYDSYSEMMQRPRVSDHFESASRKDVHKVLSSGAVLLDNPNCQFVNREGEIVDTWPIGHDFTFNDVTYRAIFMRDRTGVERVRRTIQISQDRIRDYARCGADWFWETDAQHRFVNVSSEQRPILGLHYKEMIGLTRRELALKICKDNTDLALDELFELEAQRLPVNNFEYAIRDVNGQMRYMQLNSTPILGDNGEFHGYRGASREITYQKNIEKSLVEAKDRAEQQSIAKSEFLASISHELRTPLTNILGYIELIKHKAESLEEPLNSEQLRGINIIWRNGDHLRSLINNVISIERLGSGFDRIDVDRVDIIELLEELQTSFSVAAHINKSVIAVSAEEPLPTNYYSDITKLRQIMHNLIGNALKHNEGGEIAIRVAYNADFLVIHVRDNGSGIDDRHLERIKSPPSLTNLASALEDGQGLGLLLSTQYVRLLNGEINFQCKPDEGTQITIRLPDLENRRTNKKVATLNSLPSSPAMMNELEFPIPMFTVLVVDDNSAHAELLIGNLYPVVENLHSANNGPAALKLFKEVQPDIIFMDLRMPIMDGKTVALKIRDLEKKLVADTQYKPCRIVAVTADGFTDPTSLIADGLFDACITKPYDSTEILFQLTLCSQTPPAAENTHQVLS